MTVADVLKIFEEIAPFDWAFEFDRVGLQIGDRSASVSKAAVSLDSSLAAVRFARESGCELLISHHPMIWNPLGTVLAGDVRQQVVLETIKSDLSFIAAHTNWDCAPGGINDALADRLGIIDAKPFGSAQPIEKLKLVVFVPAASADELIDALSAAGAGQIGDYSRCAFSTPGQGTFVGGSTTSPTVGSAGQVEKAEELRVEMVLDQVSRAAVENALRRVHPYEEPAYDFVRLTQKTRMRAGRIGRLPSPLDLNELVAHCDDSLSTRTTAWQGHDRPIKKLAVVGGAASGDWRAAHQAGADAFLTGEIKQDEALAAAESGLTMLQCGHYATEQPGCEWLADRLSQAGLETVLFVPEPGQAGRPL